MNEQRSLQRLWWVPVLLALLVSLNVLQNGYGWDDDSIIPTLKPPERWLSLFLPDPPTIHSPITAFLHFRPLVSVSYLLDHKMWGDNPFGFHLSVFAAHLINTALVFFLARRLVTVNRYSLNVHREPGRTQGSAPTRLGDPSDRPYVSTLGILPLLAASLFAVHPAHAEAVAWIAGRNDVFCTTFVLLSLVFYIRFHRTGSGLTFGFSMLSFFLALLTKETAVGLIVLFPLYEYLAVPQALSSAWRRIVMRWAVALGVLGLYLWMRTISTTSPYGGVSLPDLFSVSTMRDVIRAYAYYFHLMLFPYPHNPFIATLPGSTPLLILAGLEMVFLLGGVIFAWVRREVLFGIGLAWTLILLAPAALVAVFHLAATPAAERYVYAPSAGFLIASTGLILKGFEKLQATMGWPQRRVWMTAGMLLITVVTVWGRESWERNAVWRSPVTFWEAAVSASPDVGLPHRLLGIQYQRVGRYSEAETHYRQAVTIFQETYGPDHLAVGDSLFDIANLDYSQVRYSEAETLYQRVILIWERALGPDHPDLVKSIYNLALLYDAQGRYAEAEILYRRALMITEKASTPDVHKLLTYA